MKITFELTPEEVGESISAFGIDALISTSLHKWFGFDQLSDIKIKHHPNREPESVSQVAYAYIDETLDSLELYATALIELNDGRIVDFQTLDDIQGEFGCNYNAECIAKNVKGAKVIIQSNDEGDFTVVE